jgi:hypothetical protein
MRAEPGWLLPECLLASASHKPGLAPHALQPSPGKH